MHGDALAAGDRLEPVVDVEDAPAVRPRPFTPASEMCWIVWASRVMMGTTP